MMTNARSAYNKKSSLCELLYQIRPTFLILTETWERENHSLDKLLNSRVYKSISYLRKNRSPGGGCAIIYQNNNQVKFRQADIIVPENIEAVWATCSLLDTHSHMKVKRIAICSVYISPRSRFKKETVEHIILSIHQLRAQYNNDINFCIGGDFNKCDQ